MDFHWKNQILQKKVKKKKKTLQSGRKTDIFDDRIDIQIFKKQKKNGIESTM